MNHVYSQLGKPKAPAIKPGARALALHADSRVPNHSDADMSTDEAKFRLLADNMGDVFWFMDLDPLRVTYVSPAFEQIWGTPAAELYANYDLWFKAIHPDHFAAVHAAFHRWLAGETRHYEIEYRVINREGTIRWIADRGIVIGHKEGRPHQISGIARDVTERRQSEQRFHGLLESAPDAMIIVNQRGLIDQVNAQTLRLFGYTRDELLGQPMEMLMPERFRHQHTSHRTGYAVSPHARPMGKGMELFARHKGGGEFSVEISLSPLETAEGPVVISTVRDITERKHAEHVIRRLNDDLEKRVEERTLALRQANAQLREEALMRRQLEEEILHISEHEKHRIGQDLHDDLGQQLVGIWLISDVLKSNLIKQGSPETENASKINRLLKDALALTRSLARGLHPVAVQVGGLVAALDDLAARTSDMFSLDCRCKCPPAIDIDNTTATHLYRIAQEAVTNAVKHGHAKKIDIELSTNPHQTVLSVKEQGKGEDQGDVEKASEHRGMGLRIMKYRTDIIGGVLELQRNPSGIGTTVVCTIPTPESQPATISTHG